jgi:hypothetical protein
MARKKKTVARRKAARKSPARPKAKSAGSKKKLASFFVKLSRDPKQYRAFKADPDAVLARHGIAGRDRTVVKSGDVGKIRAHLGEDDPPGCLFGFIF